MLKKGFNPYLCKLNVTIDQNNMKKDNIDEAIDEMGDAFVSPNTDTPMKKDAFDKSDSEKIEIIQENVKNIMDTLGLDLTDDSLKGTPKRVAKMFVNEIFGGLHPQAKPKGIYFSE